MTSATSPDWGRLQTLPRKGRDEGGSNVSMLPSSSGESKVTRGPVRMCCGQRFKLWLLQTRFKNAGLRNLSFSILRILLQVLHVAAAP